MGQAGLEILTPEGWLPPVLGCGGSPFNHARCLGTVCQNWRWYGVWAWWHEGVGRAATGHVWCSGSLFHWDKRILSVRKRRKGLWDLAVVG